MDSIAGSLVGRLAGWLPTRGCVSGGAWVSFAILSYTSIYIYSLAKEAQGPRPSPRARAFCCWVGVGVGGGPELLLLLFVSFPVPLAVFPAASLPAGACCPPILAAWLVGWLAALARRFA